MRSGFGVDGTHKRAVAGERSLVRRDVASPLEDDPAAETLLLDDDDPFQWFVDLFVAEYASEAATRPNLPA
jgi:hypothetical protein